MDNQEAKTAEEVLESHFGSDYWALKHNGFEPHVLAAMEEYASLRVAEATKWISVKDNPPEKGITVIVLLKSDVITLGYRPIRRDRELLWQLYGDMHKITDLDNDLPLYWMPLPKPPEL